MRSLLAFEQYWKPPAGLLDAGVPPDARQGYQVIQAGRQGGRRRRLTFGGSPVFCRVPVGTDGPSVSPLCELRDRKRSRLLAFAGRTQDGALYLPLDVQEVIENFQLERYATRSPGARLRKLAREGYYRLRPLIPRRVQIKFRQAITPLQARETFPSWPLDLSLDNFQRLILGLLLDAGGIEELPFIWFWPDRYRAAVVLTHDVETQVGHDSLWRIVELERAYGFRSSWNFVPERYRVDSGVLAALAREGFEIGVHGLYHDGRLFEDLKMFRRRATRINHYVRAWGSEGFRAPSAIRNLKWIAESIDVRYDSSCPTTEIYAPQPGGCCSVFPFFVGGLVELPFTLPQDHTLFTILGETTADPWIDVAGRVVQEHGLVSVIVHPDYALDTESLDRYESLLRWLKELDSAWIALPRDVAGWWRAREQQILSRGATGWQISGPEAHRSAVAVASLSERQLMLDLA